MHARRGRTGLPRASPQGAMHACVDGAMQTRVAGLKTQLEGRCGVPAARQRFIHRGRVLRDEQSLEEAGVWRRWRPAGRRPSGMPHAPHHPWRPARRPCSTTTTMPSHNTGVEDGNTLHMVERPADAPAPGALRPWPGDSRRWGRFFSTVTGQPRPVRTLPNKRTHTHRHAGTQAASGGANAVPGMGVGDPFMSVVGCCRRRLPRGGAGCWAVGRGLAGSFQVLACALLRSRPPAGPTRDTPPTPCHCSCWRA